MERSTTETRALQSALDARDFAQLDRLLSDHFFRLCFLVPELVGRVYATATAEWFTEHPRHVMQRAVLELMWGPRRLTDAAVYAVIEPWLAAQEAPDEGDVLLLLSSHIRDANAHGWCDVGSRRTQELADRIRSSTARSTRHQDIVPVVLFLCGHVEFLAGNRQSALSLFAECLVWSGCGDPHPVAHLARGHVALIHALEQRYSEARAVLERTEPFAEAADMSGWMDAAAIVSRSLIAMGALDFAEAGRELRLIDDELINYDLGWAILAARALVTTGDRATRLMQVIAGELDRHPQRLSPRSTAGTYLRIGLILMYQRSGHLHAAQALLETQGLGHFDSSVPTVAACQALLRGQPERALAIFERSELIRGGTLSARYTAFGSVVFAEAELLATGQVSDAAVNSAVVAITHNDAPLALILAGPELRAILAPLVGCDPESLGPAAAYRPRVRLTRREQEVLAALAAHDTLVEVAAALHISRNTAKTHLAALYRKLGVHSREHALGFAAESQA